MTEQEMNREAKAYRQYRKECGYQDPVALDEIELAYFNGEKHVLADFLSFGVLLMVNSMNNAETTCKSCKYRAEDGHLSFPDCWDNHKEENRKEGKGCPYYRFDESIL